MFMCIERCWCELVIFWKRMWVVTIEFGMSIFVFVVFLVFLILSLVMLISYKFFILMMIGLDVINK